ncbi:MAG: hypothetical protein DWQ06_15610 [Calditrichaeota bacterium]|nr:MAG: hypothetical protein DWQ06_15610 [Calditrichota bacterium]
MTKLRKMTSRVALTALVTVALSSSALFAATYTIGTGTAVNSGTSYPNPLGAYYESQRTQYLYTAAELTAEGMTAGEMISEVGFYITTPNAVPALNEFIVALKNTSTTALTATYETGLTTSYGPINGESVTVSNDWHMITLDTPFTWDGTSNLVVETCMFTPPWVSNGNASAEYSVVTGGATYINTDGSSQCGTASGFASPNRANLRLIANPPTSEDIFLTSITPPNPAFAGQTQDFGINISNVGTGGLTADGNIDLDVDGDGIFDASGTFTGLAGGAAMTYNVSATVPLTFGSQTVTAAITLTSGVDGNLSNDTSDVSYDVLPTSNMAVTAVNVPTSVGANSIFAVDVTVENLGLNPADGNVDIDYENDGIVDDTQSITGLASSGAITLTFNPTAPASGTPTVMATVTQTNDIDQDPSDDSGTASYIVVPASGGPDTYGYIWESSLDGTVPANFVDISGNPGTIDLALTDDSFGTQTLPFNFNYYGTNETVVNICSNGWMNFGAGNGNSSLGFNGAWPNAAVPNGVISAFWDDLNPSSAGQVLFLDDSAANNRVIIQWNGVVAFGGSVPLFFQIHLYIDGTAEIHYLDMDENDVLNATVGWENQAGDDGILIVDNGPFVEDNLAIRIGLQVLPDNVAISNVVLNGVAPASNPISFDVTVANFGTNVADGDIEIDVDSDGVADGTASFTGLASGASTTVTINTTAPATAGPYTATATAVMTSGIDGNLNNNVGTVGYTVTPNEDAGVVSVTVTPNPVPAGAAINVDVEVQNFGGAPADITVEIDFEDDGVNDDLTTISGLAVGATQTVTFAGTAPGTAGNVTASAFVTLTSGVDGDASNDSSGVVYPVTPACVTTYPYLETFDTWATGNGAFDITTGWIQDTADDENWSVFGGNTGSSATGPTQDYTSEQGGGAGLYLYTETSGPPFGSVFNALSICYDLSSLAAPKLSYFFHMKHNLNTTGEFHLDVINLTTGITDSSVWSQIGEFQPTEASPWENAIVSLLAYAGDTVQFRFRAISGSTGFNFEYDTALDQVSIFDAADDISVTAFALNGGLAPASNPISFDVEITNTGSNVADGTVEVDLDNDGVADGTDTFAGLASGASVTLTINATAPGTAGPYTAVATATLTSGTDGNPSDNDASISYTVTPNEDLAVISVTPDALVFVGNPMNVDVQVTNLGGVSGDGNVEVDIDGDNIADGNNSFTGLASGDTTTVTVNVASAPATIGAYSANAFVTLTSGVDGDTSNDTLATGYTALPTADVGITGFDMPATTAGNSPLSIGVIVSNLSLAAADGTVDVDFDNDGTPDASDSFTGLASGAMDTLYFNTTSVATGSQTVSATVVQTNDIDQNPANDTFTATYFSVPAFGGPDAFGHTWTSSLDGAIPVDFFDINGLGTPVPGGAINSDDGTSAITLPFSFPFYGTSYTTGNVNANGWINFGGVFSGTSWINNPLVTNTNNAIFPWWDDLHLALGTILEYYDVANGRYIIQFDEVPWRTDYFANNLTPLRNTFQVIMYDNGIIEMNYEVMSASNLNQSAVGISGGSADGLQMANDTPFLGSNMSVRIDPNNVVVQPDPPVVMITGATLTWAAVPNANNYWVYTSATPNGPWSTAISAGNVLTWTDPAGVAATETNYYVTADSDAPVVAPSKSQNQVTSVVVSTPNPYGLPVASTQSVNTFKQLKIEGKLTKMQETWLKYAIQDIEKLNGTRGQIQRSNK